LRSLGLDAGPPLAGPAAGAELRASPAL